MNLTNSEFEHILDVIKSDSEIRVYELPPGIYEIADNKSRSPTFKTDDFRQRTILRIEPNSAVRRFIESFFPKIS